MTQPDSVLTPEQQVLLNAVLTALGPQEKWAESYDLDNPPTQPQPLQDKIEQLSRAAYRLGDALGSQSSSLWESRNRLLELGAADDAETMKDLASKVGNLHTRCHDKSPWKDWWWPPPELGRPAHPVHEMLHQLRGVAD